MGKRVRGAALRAKKRAKEAVEELQERQAEQLASQSVSIKPNQDLFVLDTTGDVVPHSERPPSKKKKKTTGLSEKEKQQVEKLLKKHDKEKLNQLVKAGKELVKQNVLRTHGARSKTSTNFDLWEEEKESKESTALMSATKSDIPKPGIGSALVGTAPAHAAVKATRAKRPHKPAVAVDVAKAGQSYHPEPNAYKAIIDKAVSLEVRRQQATEYKETPISTGLSEETRALLVDDSSSDESEDDSGNDGPVGPLPKRSNKLTRAQRNKQRRLRIERAIEEKRKKEKKLHSQVSEIPRYKKELKHQEQARIKQKAEQEAAKEKTRMLGKDVEFSQDDPIRAPTYPVALSSELKSSLRTIKPKGNLVTDRITSLMDRNLAPKRLAQDHKKRPHQRGKRRRLNVKGQKNNETVGKDFVVMG